MTYSVVWFQMYSRDIYQLFSPHRLLGSIVPCAIQYVLVGYVFYI